MMPSTGFEIPPVLVKFGIYSRLPDGDVNGGLAVPAGIRAGTD